jgi:hypothetical protein
MTTYRERLLPKWWVYGLAAGLVAMLSIAYGAAYDAAIGWLMFAVIFGLLALVMTTGSPIIEVNDGLRVDTARLPISCIGTVEILDPTQTREARRSRSHALDYTLLKLWSSTSSIAVSVEDTNDPHPGWLFSTRHPERIAAAVHNLRQSSGFTPEESETV